jgi:hypothetical protein
MCKMLKDRVCSSLLLQKIFLHRILSEMVKHSGKMSLRVYTT